jgi:LemA protein
MTSGLPPGGDTNARCLSSPVLRVTRLTGNMSGWAAYLSYHSLWIIFCILQFFKLNQMKKGTIILLAVLAVLLLIVFQGCGAYNNMVTKQEGVSRGWAQVENVYQRRLDLIPNLVATVKGVANFEQKTLTDVIQARANASSIKVDASKLSPEQIQKFQASQGELSQALGRLMVVAEQYPQLKATQNFLELQSQLEGTENRIAVERQRFNEVVMDYNSYIRKFPQVMFAGMMGFDKKGYFEATQGADKAPEVKF